ncbi:MAG: aspartate aminotransferase family protein, partial [Chloroflexota bacterium]
MPLTLVRGQGCRVWDDKGKKYLDLVGGWAVDVLGHSHPTLVEAIRDQAEKLLHVSNQFYTIPQVELARLLVENSCFDKAFFCNSGAEANEGAVKLARKYGKLNLGGAYEVITALNSFHGRTLAMVAATGTPRYQQPFTPMPEGFVHVVYDDIGAIKKAASNRTCAVLLEPIQGEGGVNIPKGGYFKEVRAFCDQHGLLLMLDEVQTGMGRMGSLFAYEQLGIEPDVMALAKGLGGGVAIGAFLAKEKAAVLKPGDHASTFGGNPLACAAALSVLHFILEHDILSQVCQVGAYFMSRLEQLKAQFGFIADVRGRGLLLAMEFSDNIAEEVQMSCLRKGLLVNRVRPHLLRFMPPLIITQREVDEAERLLAVAQERLR